MPPKRAPVIPQQEEPPLSSYTNFYEMLPDEMVSKKYNPNKAIHINHPCRVLVSGTSSCGKTNLILNFIKEMGGAFDQIMIFAAMPDEELYTMLQNSDDRVIICTDDLSEIPSIKDEVWECEGKLGGTLVVFDDMITKDKHSQKKISDLFVMGRKYGKKGASVLYATQKIAAVPIMIREQLTHLFVKGRQSRQSLMRLHNDCGLTCDKEAFITFCNECASTFDNFAVIDKTTTDPQYMIREGFYGV